MSKHLFLSLGSVIGKGGSNTDNCMAAVSPIYLIFRETNDYIVETEEAV